MKRHFFKKDVQKANKHMKRCSMALIIKEMQVKTKMRYHFTCTRMATIKNKQKITATDIRRRDDNDVEILEPSY